MTRQFKEFTVFTLVMAAAGAAIGYGCYGTAQAAAVGFGLGLLWLPILIIVGTLMGG